MTEEKAWNAARLIPTSGINGAEEQERRATSALLAVMSSVREFGRAMTRPYGASAGTMETYIEVPFGLGDKRVYPDGLIRVTRGSSTWTALVEVKTGSNSLVAEQLENYLDVAREHGFDALLTISNEIPPAIGMHPTAIDGRKLRKVALHHLSWTEVLTVAVMQREFRGVADPDQAWILGELIRYLEHPKSGALEFDDMGPNWVPVRDAVMTGTLRAADKAGMELASRFDALIRFSCLRLGRRLGTEVTPVLSRQETADPASRTKAVLAHLVASGSMTAQIRIPNAVSPMTIDVDLRTSRVVCSFAIDAPKQGKATTRVNWLVRQLKDAPDTVRVEAFAAWSRTGAAELLRDIRETPAKLVVDPTRDLRSFTVAQVHKLGMKGRTGRGSFIDSVLEAIDATYGEVGQKLKAWSAAPPRLRATDEVDSETGINPSLVSAAPSSQDESLPGQV
ncbi:MAG: hypothetical protein ACRCTI_04285 [Beijerinckiaceae bacterium]